MEEELVVQFTPETDSSKKGIFPVRIVKEIWREITFGVGTWGALRPLVAALLAAVPFLFLGQHFNRQHRRDVSAQRPLSRYLLQQQQHVLRTEMLNHPHQNPIHATNRAPYREVFCHHHLKLLLAHSNSMSW